MREEKEDCTDLLAALQKRVEALEAKCAAFETAFVKDDLGRPDLDGHRKGHISLIRAAQVMDSYKQEGTRGLLRWVGGAALAIFSLGFFEWIKGGIGK